MLKLCHHITTWQTFVFRWLIAPLIFEQQVLNEWLNDYSDVPFYWNIQSFFFIPLEVTEQIKAVQGSGCGSWWGSMNKLAEQSNANQYHIITGHIKIQSDQWPRMPSLSRETIHEQRGTTRCGPARVGVYSRHHVWGIDRITSLRLRPLTYTLCLKLVKNRDLYLCTQALKSIKNKWSHSPNPTLVCLWPLTANL